MWTRFKPCAPSHRVDLAPLAVPVRCATRSFSSSILPSWYRSVRWSAILRHLSHLLYFGFLIPALSNGALGTLGTTFSAPSYTTVILFPPICGAPSLGVSSPVGGTRVPFYLVGTSLRTNQSRGRPFLRFRAEAASPNPHWVQQSLAHHEGLYISRCLCLRIIAKMSDFLEAGTAMVNCFTDDALSASTLLCSGIFESLLRCEWSFPYNSRPLRIDDYSTTSLCGNAPHIRHYGMPPSALLLLVILPALLLLPVTSWGC